MAKPRNGPPEKLGQYAGGEIKDRPGTIAWWLVAVYFVLGIWALYYLVSYWGGLGPGLEY